MYEVVKDKAFPFMKKLGGNGTAYWRFRHTTTRLVLSSRVQLCAAVSG